MSNLRRVFTTGLMFVTVLAMSVVAVPQVDAAASAGDLIKMEGLSSVYYLGSDGKRYVFPNATTYFSWYEDFSGVKTIPQSELESYPLGKNITVRPGTYLVKIQTDPKVYAVEPGGDLLHVADEDTANALYGENWADRVVDVPDSFFTNYNVTGEQVTSDSYPAGSLVKFDGAEVYYIDADGDARAIGDEAAFEANRFDWDDIMNAPEGMDVPDAGDAITGFESALFDPTSGAGGQAGAGTGLTVALASDTPAAGNVPKGASAEFLKLNLTASNDGSVSVNSIKLSAYGLGNATNLDNITFYQDGLKVGTSKDMGSDREAIFNFANAVEVEAGQTESLTVKATIDADGGNYALGVAEASDITTNGAVVSGAFPVQGNIKSVVTGVTIGTVSLSGMNADTATAQVGEDDVLLAEFTLNTAEEPIIWNSARFEQKDDTGVASNYRIMVEGDEVATAEEEGDFITFDMGSYLIDKGDNVDVEVYGDIGLGDASDTVNLQIDDVNDFDFVGQDYGFGVEMDTTGSTGIVVSLEADDVSIDMDKSADGTPSKEVRGDSDDVTLATMRLVSNGEDAEIEDFAGTDGSADFEIRGSGLECDEIENVELYSVDSGSIYDLSVASGTNSNNCVLTLGEDIYLTQGTEYEFEVRADLKDNIGNGDELRVYVADSAFTITGQATDESLSLSPTNVSGAVITVQEASMTWTTQPMTDQSFVTGANEKAIFKATVEAGDSSDLDLRSVTLTASTASGAIPEAFDDENFSEIRAYLNGELLENYSSDISLDGQSGANIKLDSFDASNRVIPAGERYTFLVEADFNSSFNPTGDFNLKVAAKSDIDVDDEDGDDVAAGNKTVNTGVISRDVTLAETGSVKVEMKTDDTDANNDFYLLAGSENASDKYLGELVFTTQYEEVEVESITLAQQGTANNGDIAAVKLYDEAGDLVAGDGVDGSGNVEFDFATGELVLPADEATSFYVAVEAKSINADGDDEGTAEFGKTVQYAINSVDTKGYNSGEDITMSYTDGTVGFGEYSTSTVTTNIASTTGAKLTSIVSEDLSDDLLTGGTSDLAKYKFVFDNGSNRTASNEELKAQMKTLTLTVSASSGVTATTVQAYIEGNASDLTDPVDQLGSTITIDLTDLDGDNELVDGEVTLVIEGVLEGVTENDYFQTSIADLTGGDFVYNGNHGAAGADISNPLLDITKVTGDKLTN